jgi:hypothetical protein
MILFVAIVATASLFLFGLAAAPIPRRRLRIAVLTVFAGGCTWLAYRIGTGGPDDRVLAAVLFGPAVVVASARVVFALLRSRD